MNNQYSTVSEEADYWGKFLMKTSVTIETNSTKIYRKN